MGNKKTKHIDPETKAIQKYKEPVLKILRDLADNRQLSAVCREKLNRMKPGRLTELHTGTRSLTPYYLSKLIQGGVVTIDQILQAKRLQDLPKEDQLVLRKISLDDELVALLGEAIDKGEDMKHWLRTILKKDNSNQ